MSSEFSEWCVCAGVKKPKTTKPKKPKIKEQTTRTSLFLFPFISIYFHPQHPTTTRFPKIDFLGDDLT